MGVDHKIVRHSGQFRGLDKRSSDVDRTIEYSSNMKNAAYRSSGSINKRKGYPLYPVEQLEIYKKSNIKNMYQNFQYFFTEQYHSVKLISENFHRQRVARSVEEWLKQNACHFEV